MNQSKLENYAVAFLKTEIEHIEKVLEEGVASTAEYDILKGLLSEYKSDYDELMEEDEF